MRPCTKRLARSSLPVKCQAAKEVTLPNGLRIRHVSTADEALFFYQEHFVDRVYLRNGIQIMPGDTVVDVGANIGIFAMTAAEACGPTGRVVSLEPIPEVAEACRENVRRHREWCGQRGVGVAPVEVINAAAGDGSCREAEFTVYERASGWSTMDPDDDETMTNMEAYISNRLALMAGGTPSVQPGGAGWEQPSRCGAERGEAAAAGTIGRSSSDGSGGANSGVASSGNGIAAGSVGGQEPSGWLERLLLPVAAALQRLPATRGTLGAMARAYVSTVLMGEQRQVRCSVVTLHDVIREAGLRRVGLLKVDVERAELAVLRGMGPADWDATEQVVMEVHRDKGTEAGDKGGGERGRASEGAGGMAAWLQAPPPDTRRQVLGQGGASVRGDEARVWGGSVGGRQQAGAGDGAASLAAGPAEPGIVRGSGRLGEVRAVLLAAGFRVVVDQDAQLAGTSLTNVYATRMRAADSH